MHAGLANLTRLSLHLVDKGTILPTSSKGLRWIAHLTALEELSFDRLFFSKAGAFRPLGGLSKLRALDFGDCQFKLPPDCLAPLTQLQWLRLPSKFCTLEDLPPGLQFPYKRGSRQEFAARSSEDLVEEL